MHNLTTSLPELSLVTPDPARDAPQAVEWLKGESGKQTLLLMGNLEHKITAPTLDAEHQRLEEFLTLAKEEKQLTWMMRYQHKTIGAVWLELEATKHLPAPAVHIMIGDPSARRQGIGRATIAAIVQYLKAEAKHPNLYSRYLTSNAGSIKLLAGLGFTSLGSAYTDGDGLEFQNVVLNLASA
jgi:RimJ/RimL family protein N-acetyltransferase